MDIKLNLIKINFKIKEKQTSKHYTTASRRLSTDINKSINKAGPSRPIAVINRRTDSTVQRFSMRKSAK